MIHYYIFVILAVPVVGKKTDKDSFHCTAVQLVVERIKSSDHAVNCDINLDINKNILLSSFVCVSTDCYCPL